MILDELYSEKNQHSSKKSLSSVSKAHCVRVLKPLLESKHLGLRHREARWGLKRDSREVKKQHKHPNKAPRTPLPPARHVAH